MTPSPQRFLTNDDLVEIADLGGLSVSPDGALAVFQVQEPDNESDSIRTSWWILNVSTGSSWNFDYSNQPILLHNSRLGYTDGYIPFAPPKWSPDGDKVAYILRSGDQRVLRVWSSTRDAKPKEFRIDGDVTDFVWLSGGQSILYERTASPTEIESAFDREARNGILIDQSFWPSLISENFRRNPEGIRNQSYLEIADLADGIAGKSLHQYDIDPSIARKLLNSKFDQNRLTEGDLFKSSQYEVHRFAKNAEENELGSHVVVTNTHTGIDYSICDSDECGGSIKSTWWHEDDVLCIEGVVEITKVTLNCWSPPSADLRLVWEGDRAFRYNEPQCRPVKIGALCAVESTTYPRRLALVDFSSSETKVVFDPNQKRLSNVKWPAVQELSWSDKFGNPAKGHLVYPADYDPARRYPLVIVQYRSWGFLRGGVGNEYPIFPLAAEGFFVLSFDRPESTLGLNSSSPASRQVFARESALSAIEEVVDALVTEGLVLKDNVGLSGFSNGAETASFAAIHSEYFAALSVSQISFEPIAYYLLGKEGRRIGEQIFGVSPPTAEGPGLWGHVSLSLNVGDISVPILVQTSLNEYLPAMQSLTEFERCNKPMEVFVFPDAYHNKWRPAQRHSVYERNVDWFVFWLQPDRYDDSQKPAQSKRWQQLRSLEEVSPGC